MLNDQWKQDMFDGITAAFMSNTITINEAGRLRMSSKKTINSEQMGADTARRTGGLCPTKCEYLNHQFISLVKVFEKLKQKLSGR